MQRIVMKPEGMTFSNGITLPKGTYVGIAERATHLDEGLSLSFLHVVWRLKEGKIENFIDAQQFKPFRFLEEDGTPRETMVKVGVDCLTFGAGRFVPSCFCYVVGYFTDLLFFS